jgi:hypothetical protein
MFRPLLGSSSGKFHKTKLLEFSCSNMDLSYAVFVVVIITEYTLKNVNNI